MLSLFQWGWLRCHKARLLLLSIRQITLAGLRFSTMGDILRAS